MFNLPLSFLPNPPQAARGRHGETKPSSQGLPPATARVVAAAGQRRWTVVVPRRLTARAAQALADAGAAQSAQPAVAGPIRFRPQATMFGVIATVASGLYVYSEKHAAASLDREIAHAYQASAAARQQSSVLRAEWALLNNPDRLRPLTDRYLSLQPVNAAQFVRVADLRTRLPKVLYGPPAPLTDDDAAAPPIVTKHLLARAEVPAPPEVAPPSLAPAPGSVPDGAPDATAEAPADAPAQPVRTPIVAGPAHAFRVLAHAGAMPAIVDADPAVAVQDHGEAAAVPDEAPRAPAEARPWHPVAAPAWHQVPRPSAPATLPQAPPRLAVHAEPPRLRLPRPAMLLRPELVHMLMMQHPLTTTWTRPAVPAAKPQPPLHHVEYGRSDPPRFLAVPQAAPAAPAPAPQQYAQARPRDVEQPRQDVWTPPPVTYRPPPVYAYRPYWGGYSANPYAGYSYQPRPVYPGYQ